MGVLSDLVVANAGDAEQVAKASVPSKAFGGIDIKGIESVKFGTLHSIVTGTTDDEAMAHFDPVAMRSDDGPWVFQIPKELVEKLAALDEAGLARVAKKWAATEEFALDRWDAGDVASALDAIALLAKKALEPGMALFLWMSL